MAGSRGLRWVEAAVCDTSSCEGGGGERVGGGHNHGMGVPALCLPVWLKSEPLGLVLNILDVSTCGSFKFGTPGLVSQVFKSL